MKTVENFTKTFSKPVIKIGSVLVGGAVGCAIDGAWNRAALKKFGEIPLTTNWLGYGVSSIVGCCVMKAVEFGGKAMLEYAFATKKVEEEIDIYNED